MTDSSFSVDHCNSLFEAQQHACSMVGWMDGCDRWIVYHLYTWQLWYRLMSTCPPLSLSLSVCVCVCVSAFLSLPCASVSFFVCLLGPPAVCCLLKSLDDHSVVDKLTSGSGLHPRSPPPVNQSSSHAVVKKTLKMSLRLASSRRLKPHSHCMHDSFDTFDQTADRLFGTQNYFFDRLQN